MRKRNNIALLLLLLPFIAFSQDEKKQEEEKQRNWFIAANINVYQPLGTGHKARFPVLWYNNETKPAIQIGGFGVGVAHTISYKKNSYFKVAANLSKHTYWDEPIVMTDFNAQPMGTLQRWGSDFNLNLLGTIHHKVSKNISFGIGAGFHTNLLSVTAVPKWDRNQFAQTNDIAFSNYYKTIVPFIPAEINFLRKKATYTIRYEQALLNKMAAPLSDYFKDRYGIFYLEGAWRLR